MTKLGLAAVVSLALWLVVGPSAALAGQDSNNFTYGGQPISEDEVLGGELVCVMGPDVNSCFDSEAEADDASNPAARGVTPAAAPCPVRNLFEFVGVNYSGGGPSLSGNAVGLGWLNYARIYNAETTSFRTGDYRANFNGRINGLGAKYGIQPVCAAIPNLVGSGWNDRFRSRKRFP